MAATAGIVAARLTGVVPELSLVPGAAHSAATLGARTLRGRELRGAALDRAVARASQDKNSAALRAHLVRQGFVPVSGGSGVSIEASDAGPIGLTVVRDFRARDPRLTARLVFQEGNGVATSALAIWDDDRPNALSIHGVRDGEARRLGSVEIGADEIMVDDIETGRRVYPRRFAQTVASKGPGLAALAGPQTQTAAGECQELCGWVVGTYCGLVCEYSFFVVCAVILGLTGLPGLACFLVSFATCTLGCYQTQSWACTTVCA
jgi:hypothetical protein